MRREKSRVARSFFLYRIASRLVWILSRLFLDLRVEGTQHVPLAGGLLVVSNHASNTDPPLVASTCPRPLIFMGKTELFRNPLAGALLRAWHVFPVRRGEVDVAAVRLALSLLKEGSALVIFPEGTRHPEGLGRATPGIGYLAGRSACPVLPVAIAGSAQIRGFMSLLRRPQVRVRFGKPFTIETGNSEEAAELIMRSIAELLPPDQRGHYLAGGAPSLDVPRGT